jgi:hypothetical protein
MNNVLKLIKEYINMKILIPKTVFIIIILFCYTPLDGQKIHGDKPVSATGYIKFTVIENHKNNWYEDMDWIFRWLKNNFSRSCNSIHLPFTSDRDADDALERVGIPKKLIEDLKKYHEKNQNETIINEIFRCLSKDKNEMEISSFLNKSSKDSKSDDFIKSLCGKILTRNSSGF